MNASKIRSKRRGDLSNNMKTFVIDTNVFIHRPDAILSFRDNEIVIPLSVLEELDHLKSYSDERGRNARQAIRFIDGISSHGNLNEGVKLDNGSVLRVELTNAKENALDLELTRSDNRILLAAYLLQKAGKRVFFVTKDINARVKATAIGIKAVDYEKQKVNIHELYQGFIEVDSSAEILRQLRDKRYIDWPDKLVPNEYVILRDRKNEGMALSRYDSESGKLRYVSQKVSAVSGIRALNEHQRIAFDLLLNDSIPLVSLVGKAGTGKTLLALAASLTKVLEEKRYSRILVGRPVVPMGKDIGYLPGQKSEKLSHWMQPVFDNLEFILSVTKFPNVKTIDQLMSTNLIEIEALTYLRGRSLPGQYIIIDESQNLSPHEIKTIVSRAGSGTKVVLTGDPYQIDSPYLDSNSNGLTYLVGTCKGQGLFGHITLQKTERSDLAEMAAELL
jgi:PhoH-like ATPase